MIYTAIINAFTRLQNVCINNLGIGEIFKIVPSLFNEKAITYFYDMLAGLGVKEVNYYEVIDGYQKHYGYLLCHNLKRRWNIPSQYCEDG